MSKSLVWFVEFCGWLTRVENELVLSYLERRR